MANTTQLAVQALRTGRTSRVMASESLLTCANRMASRDLENATQIQASPNVLVAYPLCESIDGERDCSFRRTGSTSGKSSWCGWLMRECWCCLSAVRDDGRRSCRRRVRVCAKYAPPLIRWLATLLEEAAADFRVFSAQSKSRVERKGRRKSGAA